MTEEATAAPDVLGIENYESILVCNRNSGEGFIISQKIPEGFDLSDLSKFKAELLQQYRQRYNQEEDNQKKEVEQDEDEKLVQEGRLEDEDEAEELEQAEVYDGVEEEEIEQEKLVDEEDEEDEDEKEEDDEEEEGEEEQLDEEEEVEEEEEDIDEEEEEQEQEKEEEQQQSEVYDSGMKADVTSSCSSLSNYGYNATPRKLLCKRRLESQESNENYCCVQVDMELIPNNNGQGSEMNMIVSNPYEVVRIPPKKKKCTANDACFVNPALNLDSPEVQFNPYEVKRSRVSPKATNCFTNAALNLKSQTGTAAVHNPFEVSRSGVEGTCPTRHSLTSSKLLTEKLPFSPVNVMRDPLEAIGEESSLDIGKELDRYQLELENSINEAKLRRKGINISPLQESESQSITEVMGTNDIKPQLYGIIEEDEEDEDKEEDDEEDEEEDNDDEDEEDDDEDEEDDDEDDDDKGEEQDPLEEEKDEEEQEKELMKNDENNRIMKKELYNENVNLGENCKRNTNPFLNDSVPEDTIGLNTANLNELYGYSDSQDDENDLPTSTTFVRNYRKADAPILTVSKESLQSYDKQAKKFRHRLRASLRKLLPADGINSGKSIADFDKAQIVKQNPGFMTTLRKSLRCKPLKEQTHEIENQSNGKENEDVNENDKNPNKNSNENALNASIIDTNERTMKLKTDLMSTEYMKIEDLTNEHKRGLRQRLRRSTRDIKQQFMKTVFNNNNSSKFINN